MCKYFLKFNNQQLNTGVTGQLYYLTQDYLGTNYTLSAYNIADRKTDEVMKGINGYIISNDGKKMIYAGPDDMYGIVNAPGKANVGDSVLKTSEIKIYADPAKEWEQMYNEVWRVVGITGWYLFYIMGLIIE